MKIENIKTFVGLTLLAGGICVLMLGALIPGDGKLIALMCILLGLVVIFSKKTINFNSLMGGHVGGPIHDKDDE